MSDIIRFLKRFKPPPALSGDDPYTVYAEQRQRHFKYQQWRYSQRRWGGGHRKPDGKLNPDAIATFDISRTEWSKTEYRQSLAAEIVKALLAAGKIGIGRLGLYQFRKGVWKHQSDRMIIQRLNENINFTRDGHIPVKPPRWLPEAMRFVRME